jgi:hypothetical protein
MRTLLGSWPISVAAPFHDPLGVEVVVAFFQRGPAR